MTLWLKVILCSIHKSRNKIPLTASHQFSFQKYQPEKEEEEIKLKLCCGDEECFASFFAAKIKCPTQWRENNLYRISSTSKHVLNTCSWIVIVIVFQLNDTAPFNQSFVWTIYTVWNSVFTWTTSQNALIGHFFVVQSFSLLYSHYWLLSVSSQQNEESRALAGDRWEKKKKHT